MLTFTLKKTPILKLYYFQTNAFQNYLQFSTMIEKFINGSNEPNLYKTPVEIKTKNGDIVKIDAVFQVSFTLVNSAWIYIYD